MSFDPLSGEARLRRTTAVNAAATLDLGQNVITDVVNMFHESTISRKQAIALDVYNEVIHNLDSLTPEQVKAAQCLGSTMREELRATVVKETTETKQDSGVSR